jgi:hypothetical protein
MTEFNSNRRQDLTLARELAGSSVPDPILSVQLDGAAESLTSEVKECVVKNRENSPLKTCLNLEADLNNASTYAKGMISASTPVDPNVLVNAIFSERVDAQTVECLTSARSEEKVDECVADASEFVGRLPTPNETQPVQTKPSDEVVVDQVSPREVPDTEVNYEFNFDQEKKKLYDKLFFEVRKDLKAEKGVLQSIHNRGEDWKAEIRLWANNKAADIFPDYGEGDKGVKAKRAKERAINSIAEKVITDVQGSFQKEVKSYDNTSALQFATAIRLLDGIAGYLGSPVSFTTSGNIIPFIDHLAHGSEIGHISEETANDFWIRLGRSLTYALSIIPRFLSSEAEFLEGTGIERLAIFQKDNPVTAEVTTDQLRTQGNFYPRNGWEALGDLALIIGGAAASVARAMDQPASQAIEVDSTPEPSFTNPNPEPEISILNISNGGTGAYFAHTEAAVGVVGTYCSLVTRGAFKGDEPQERAAAGLMAGVCGLASSLAIDQLGRTISEKGLLADADIENSGRILPPDIDFDDLDKLGEGVADDISERMDLSAYLEAGTQVFFSEETAKPAAVATQYVRQAAMDAFGHDNFNWGERDDPLAEASRDASGSGAFAWKARAKLGKKAFGGYPAGMAAGVLLRETAFNESQDLVTRIAGGALSGGLLVLEGGVLVAAYKVPEDMSSGWLTSTSLLRAGLVLGGAIPAMMGYNNGDLLSYSYQKGDFYARASLLDAPKVNSFSPDPESQFSQIEVPLFGVRGRF